MIQHQHRHTIYDVMEAKGVFRSNPANFYAIDSEGLPAHVFQAYPKMLYHPKAETRIVVPEEEEVSKGGRVRTMGGLREVIHQIVNNEAEEQRLLAEGWHPTLAKALRANGVANAPVESPSELIAESAASLELANARAMAAEAELAVMRAKLAEASAQAGAQQAEFMDLLKEMKREQEEMKEKLDQVT